MSFQTRFAADYATYANGGAADWTVPAVFPRPGGATCVIPSGGSQYSYELQLSNWGFAIPAGATITGISATASRRLSAGTGPVKDYTVNLGALTSNKADLATSWPGSLTSAVYGGSGDLWGASWSVANINASSFTFIIAAQNYDFFASATALVDSVQMLVEYTGGFDPATGLPPAQQSQVRRGRAAVASYGHHPGVN